MSTYYAVFLIVSLLLPGNIIDVSIAPVVSAEKCSKWEGIIKSDFHIQAETINENEEDELTFYTDEERTKLINVQCRRIEIKKVLRT